VYSVGWISGAQLKRKAKDEHRPRIDDECSRIVRRASKIPNCPNSCGPGWPVRTHRPPHAAGLHQPSLHPSPDMTPHYVRNWWEGRYCTVGCSICRGRKLMPFTPISAPLQRSIASACLLPRRNHISRIQRPCHALRMLLSNPRGEYSCFMSTAVLHCHCPTTITRAARPYPPPYSRRLLLQRSRGQG